MDLTCNTEKYSRAPLEAFLARHPAFGGWRDAWEGVPLEFRSCLSHELPPQAFIGSVRALVLRNNEVLLIHASVPILVVGGRLEPGKTVEQTLHCEVAEETGWLTTPLGVIGFIHCRHLDERRPDWGRPAPDFIDPIFAVTATSYDRNLKGPNESACEFVQAAEVKRFGVEKVNCTFLSEALRLCGTLD